MKAYETELNVTELQSISKTICIKIEETLRQLMNDLKDFNNQLEESLRVIQFRCLFNSILFANQ